jgi:hypothetical protein
LQSIHVTIKSLDGRFISTKEVAGIQRNGSVEEKDEIYHNDFDLLIPATEWQPGADGEFAASYKFESSGDSEDLTPMEFTLSVNAQKEKSWSYTF